MEKDLPAAGAHLLFLASVQGKVLFQYADSRALHQLPEHEVNIHGLTGAAQYPAVPSAIPTRSGQWQDMDGSTEKIIPALV